MPLQREHLQLAALLLCVPLQYYVVQYSGSSESTRTYQISLIVNQVKDFHSRWLRIEPWTRWCHRMLLKIVEGPLSEPPADSDVGESPAVEVLKFREEHGHFSTSSVVRQTRGPHIKFRIGQVIKHKRWGYR